MSFSLLNRYDSGSTFSAVDGFGGNFNGNGFNVSVFPGLGLPSYAPNQISGATFSPYSSGRGAFRNNDSHQTDFTISYSVPIVGKVQLTSKLDISNLFNTTMLTSYNNYFAADSRNPGQTGLGVSDPSIFGTGNQSIGFGNSVDYLFGRTWTASIAIKF